MYKSRRKKELAIRKATAIFVDHNKFSEQELLGYYELVKKLYGEDEATRKVIKLEELINVVKTLGYRYQKLIQLRFVERNSQDVVGKYLGVSRERARQLEVKGISKTLKKSRTFCIDERQTFDRQKELFIWQAGTGKVIENDISISELKLSRNSYNSLIRCNIDTIGKLMNCTIDEYIAIRGCGKKVKNEVFKALRDFLPKGDELVKHEFSIRITGLLPRYVKRIEAAGIKTVNQLCDYSKMDIPNIPGLTDLGIEKTISCFKEIFPNWEKHHEKRLNESDTNIYFLNFSKRTYTALSNVGVKSIGQLVKLTNDEILEIPQIGEKSLREINDYVESYMN